MGACGSDAGAELVVQTQNQTGRTQVLPLSEESTQLLGQLAHAGRYVFPGETPDVPWSRTAVQYWWRKLRRQAGCPDVQIRDLRRTCASWMTMQGENLKVIQTVLNHTNLSTTQVYARLDQASLRAALNRHAHRTFPAHAPVRG